MQKITQTQISNSTSGGSFNDAAINGITYIAHRGGPNVLPEHTMEAYRGIVRAGAKVIELDCYLLADGTLGIMHDSTLTRTTTSSGNTADQTALSWAGLTIDEGANLGGIFTSKTFAAPTLDEVLREFGNRVALCIEGKNTGACDAIVAKLQEYNIALDSAMVQSFTLGQLSGAVNAGYLTMALGNNLTPATVASAGVGYVGCSTSASSSYISSLLAENLEVFVYTVDYHYIRDTFIGYGVTGFFSDDPIYLAEQHRLTTDPFGSQTWYHGMLKAAGTRGNFQAPNRFGLNATVNGDRYQVLQGWACPINGNADTDTFTINFNLRFDEIPTSRWASIWVGANTDKPYIDVGAGVGDNGYHCLFRDNGTLDIYRIDDGVATQIATKSGSAITTGVNYAMRLTMTPTSVKWERVGNYSVTANDTNHRGGYFQFGCRGTAKPYFSNVVIT